KSIIMLKLFLTPILSKQNQLTVSYRHHIFFGLLIFHLNILSISAQNTETQKIQENNSYLTIKPAGFFQQHFSIVKTGCAGNLFISTNKMKVIRMKFQWAGMCFTGINLQENFKALAGWSITNPINRIIHITG
ncbi:MAG: hypothetical protein ACOCUL_03735, partial [Bacteroidota bacterium]